MLTDDGERAATKFYVNGLEQVVDVRTERGYRITGTAKHRIKVVDEVGEWVWRRFSDLRQGDRVPLSLGQLIGRPNEVGLPPLSEKLAWAGEHHVDVPAAMSPELAELVGYFMGDGSLHSRGLRLCVTNGDLDVIDHLERLAKELFGIQARVMPQQGLRQRGAALGATRRVVAGSRLRQAPPARRTRRQGVVATRARCRPPHQ